MSRWVLHIDMDQFLAAVELLRRPELRGLPVVVGGDGDPTKRGVVSTASYEARAFGVGSGMALRTALKKCPQAIFLPVDFPVYEAASERVMQTLRGLGGTVEVIGWDEAFIGIETDDPHAFAAAARAAVRDATELNSCVGIGLNKLQAKIATNYAKHRDESGTPAGIFELTEATWFGLLGDLPVTTIWGIGAGFSKRLNAMGVETVSDLAAADTAALAAEFGPSIGPWLGSLGRGEMNSPVSDVPREAKGRSKEVTYQQNIEDWSEVESEIARIAREAASDGDQVRSVQRVFVKVRYAPFFTYTKGRKLPQATDDPDLIAQGALHVLSFFEDRRAVRLLGVRVEYTQP